MRSDGGNEGMLGVKSTIIRSGGREARKDVVVVRDSECLPLPVTWYFVEYFVLGTPRSYCQPARALCMLIHCLVRPSRP